MARSRWESRQAVTSAARCCQCRRRLQFQNPVVLAAGTAAYGHELASVVNLSALGGLVTKAVSPEPLAGAPAPRVAEFGGGMITPWGSRPRSRRRSVRDHLPWLATSLPGAQAGHIVGFAVQEFAGVIEQLELSLQDEAAVRSMATRST